MKLCRWCGLSASCLLPQDPPKPAPDQAQAAAAKDEKVATPAPPATEQNVNGSIEFGYRFIPSVNGSFNTYRSVVNRGEGPKLFGADATILNPNRRFFDRLDLHLTSIGADPYDTAKLAVFRPNPYRLTFDSRNIT